MNFICGTIFLYLQFLCLYWPSGMNLHHILIMRSYLFKGALSSEVSHNVVNSRCLSPCFHKLVYLCQWANSIMSVSRISFFVNFLFMVIVCFVRSE